MEKDNIDYQEMKKIIEMNAYIAMKRQEEQIRQAEITENIKKKNKKAKILAVVLATSLGIGGTAYGVHAVNNAIDTKDYLKNLPKSVEEVITDENEYNYDTFLQYQNELREQGAPDAFTAPTEENYRLYLEEMENQNKGGKTL